MKIYYNPRCSKCREALEISRKNGKEPEIVEYMLDGFSEAGHTELISKVGIKAEDLLRKNEKTYIENYKTKKMTEKQWIKVMAKHPELVQRPIIVDRNRVILGRPPETVLQLFKKK